MIAGLISNKSYNLIVTELFIRGRKLNISFVFMTQLFFKVPKDVKLNSTHYLIMKILKKRELQQTVINLSSDIYFETFMDTYNKCTTKQYSFIVDNVNDTTLTPSNSLRFRKNLLEIMTINVKIRDEKPHSYMNREAAKISALSSAKIDKSVYLTCKEISASDQSQIIQ